MVLSRDYRAVEAERGLAPSGLLGLLLLGLFRTPLALIRLSLLETFYSSYSCEVLIGSSQISWSVSTWRDLLLVLLRLDLLSRLSQIIRFDRLPQLLLIFVADKISQPQPPWVKASREDSMQLASCATIAVKVVGPI